jgi:hypothetical protein
MEMQPTMNAKKKREYKVQRVYYQNNLETTIEGKDEE